MASLVNLAKVFLGFAMVSGVGWLCDMVTFTVLVRLLDTPAFLANFISSYAGVTFVWFVSLKMVFRRQGSGRNLFLLVYWGFQFISILGYSQLLHVLAAALPQVTPWHGMPWDADIAAKIIITPFNLITNFIFMKLLVRHMHADKHDYV